jgi:adenylylsulfate kinase-like enzyme
MGENFNCVYIKADLKTCEKRDVKGLYKKARAGQITNFTGVSDRFEEPENADIIIDTDKLSIKQNVDLLEEYVMRNFVEPLNNIVSGDDIDGGGI